MAFFNDLDFLHNLTDYLAQNLTDIKDFGFYQLPHSPEFPCVVMSMNNMPTDIDTIDSSRIEKFYDIEMAIDIFVKAKSESNPYEKAMKIKNDIRYFVQESVNFRNLYVTYDKNIPNFDSNVVRWRIIYQGKVNVQTNTLL